MPCELCGKEVRGCKPAIIDGARMIVCPDCIRYGTAVVEAKKPVTSSQKTKVQRPKKAYSKDIYKEKDTGKELVDDWSVRIQNGRKKKGLTREELGFKIGERTVIISKLENGDLRPSDKMIIKLEKELDISLMEEVSKLPNLGGKTSGGGGFTLGDFVKTEE